MAWGVGPPRQSKDGKTWEVPITDYGGADRMILRYETADQASNAANTLRAAFVGAVDVQLVEGDAPEPVARPDYMTAEGFQKYVPVMPQPPKPKR